MVPARDVEREIRSPEAFQRCLRDVLALATLPAIWIGAEPARVAESLAAALFATLRPTLVFVSIQDAGGRSRVAVAQTGRHSHDERLADALCARVSAWAREHDPDELLVTSHPMSKDEFRLAVHGIGFDASIGVIAAAFGSDGPSPMEHTLLGLAATQAASAAQNALLVASLRDSVAQRKRAEEALAASVRHKDTLYALANRLYRSARIEDVYDAAMDAILAGLQCNRASVLLADAGGTMRFVASRGLSESYRRAVEGHSPWSAHEADPRPICVADITNADVPATLMQTVVGEGIRALAFFPLVQRGRLIGKFMTYYDEPHVFDEADVGLALAIARHIAFALERTRAEEQLRENERRFREMIDALPAAVYTTDAEGRLTHFNPAAVKFSGRVPVLGSDRWCVSWKLYYPDGRPMPHDACPFAVALKEGRVVHGAEAIAELPDGTRRWFTPFPTPVRDAAGRIVGGINMLVDITERKLAEETEQRRMEEIRRLANEKAALVTELQAADRRKDEFLAMLSHELRNPLAPIRTAVELLGTVRDDSPVLVNARAVLSRQVSHMVKLVDDLLDVARITRGSISLDRKAVDLNEIVQNAIELSRPGIESAGHALDVRLPKAPIKLFVDPVRMAQVVANLLNNSARYTPRRGEIRVEAGADDGFATISVRDNGIGIAPDMLPRVFDLFTQASTRNRPARGGLGIGLSLAKALVEMHGGMLEGRSEGEGRGSEFVVRVPALAAPAATTAPPVHEASPVTRRRVLVVDDNVDAADSLSLLLQQMGHEVHIAYDARSALAEASACVPEIVLLDLSLPETDGFSLAAQLRDLHGDGLRLVAVTGHGRAEDQRRTREAGFEAHLVKPIAVDALYTFLSTQHSPGMAARML
jgi:signal transduction histidine kinase/GAF domain-containing protein/CheY-like chemotaxis protein